MDDVDSIVLDTSLLNDLESMAVCENIDIDDYITLLLEEEILKEITISFVSDSSIY